MLFALAMACALLWSGSARAEDALVDRVLQKLQANAEMRTFDLARWKVHTNMDTRCVDAHFVPDKTWRSTSTGYMFQPSEKGIWLWTKYVMPEAVDGMPVKGAKVVFRSTIARGADVYVNGRWTQNFTGDNGDALVTRSAAPGEEFVILLHATTARMGGIFAKAYLQFSAPSAAREEINLYANDVRIVRNFIGYAPDPAKWNEALDRSAKLVDLGALDRKDSEALAASIRAARKELDPVKDVTRKLSLYLIGYSHIDLAWLWDKKEGEEVWLNTSRTILNLMNEYPDWIYCAGQAAGYAYMERDYPDVWKEIKQRVAEGRWEIVGGTWAEFDSNLPGGESYIRHLLYGKRWFREKFGKDIVVAWTPDSFGYNWNLAQIYRKAGMVGFLTQKINWNDTTRFPYHIFWWESPDGSKLMTYFPVGGYGESLDTDATLSQIKTMKDTTGVPESYAIFGVGDHGGGVTRTQLDRAFAFKSDPLFPETKFISADGYFKHLLDLSKTHKFPVYNNELYLEYHRGTYTSQANTKRNNRFGEMSLMKAETFASIASRMGRPYEGKQLRDAWDILMFNQFHDVLPGSSINPVYKDAAKDYAEMFRLTGGVLDGALDSIAQKANTAGKGRALMIFNPLAWTRDDVMEIETPDAENATVLDPAGKPVPSQVADGKLLFVAKNLPAMGYAVYRVVPGKPKAAAGAPGANGTSLENEFFRVTVDPKTGNISSLVDKRTKREFFGAGHEGNMLQCYRDLHPEYDAWNIRLHEEKPVSMGLVPEIVENGPVRVTLRWTKTIGKSTFVHYLSLVRGVPLVFGRLEVDWHEEHVMAKLAFNLNLKSDTAWYEIPYAAIGRAAVAKTDADRAKWEVSAQKWVDYTDGGGAAGIMLLNNSKYGYDTKGSVMRMSLLRSPKDPDPEADMGHHSIEYALNPHAGDWRAAQAPRRGYEFNARAVAKFVDAHPGALPAVKSFFAVEPANVILASVKKAEDSNDLVLRLYEATGKDSKFKVTLPATAKAAVETNLLEETPKKMSAGAAVQGPIGHYEIKTVKVSF